MLGIAKIRQGLGHNIVGYHHLLSGKPLRFFGSIRCSVRVEESNFDRTLTTIPRWHTLTPAEPHLPIIYSASIRLFTSQRGLAANLTTSSRIPLNITFSDQVLLYTRIRAISLSFRQPKSGPTTILEATRLRHHKSPVPQGTACLNSRRSDVALLCLREGDPFVSECECLTDPASLIFSDLSRLLFSVGLVILG